MRAHVMVGLVALGCGGSQPAPSAPAPAPVAPPASGPAEVADDGPKHERIAAEARRTTARGAEYVVPAGWRVITSGLITILDVEGVDVQIAIVDAEGADADTAVASAWGLFRSTPPPAGAKRVAGAARRGWDERVAYQYPDASHMISANALQRGETWTVVIADQAPGIPTERASQAGQIVSSLLAQP